MVGLRLVAPVSCFGLEACLKRITLLKEGSDPSEVVAGLRIAFVGVAGFEASLVFLFFLGFFGVFGGGWCCVGGMAVLLLGLEELATEAGIYVEVRMEVGWLITVGSPFLFTVAQSELGMILGRNDYGQLVKLHSRIAHSQSGFPDIRQQADWNLYDDAIGQKTRWV
jgi:hypothetical protein